jgi:hypothetical protein
MNSGLNFSVDHFNFWIMVEAERLTGAPSNPTNNVPNQSSERYSMYSSSQLPFQANELTDWMLVIKASVLLLRSPLPSSYPTLGGGGGGWKWTRWMEQAKWRHNSEAYTQILAPVVCDSMQGTIPPVSLLTHWLSHLCYVMLCYVMLVFVPLCSYSCLLTSISIKVNNIVCLLCSK